MKRNLIIMALAANHINLEVDIFSKVAWSFIFKNRNQLEPPARMCI